MTQITQESPSEIILLCLAQGHNAVMPERLEPGAPLSEVKHSTTEPLRSLDYMYIVMCMVCYAQRLYLSRGFCNIKTIFPLINTHTVIMRRFF